MWATQVCMMQIPGSNWSATDWLFQYLAVHCSIHYACYTASPFWRTVSSQMYCLCADCVIHCMLRIARSLFKAAKTQKQWKVYKLRPTPDLLKHSKLTILTVIFVFSAQKLVKTCYSYPSEAFWLLTGVIISTHSNCWLQLPLAFFHTSLILLEWPLSAHISQAWKTNHHG